jgi:uncharacterized protein (TIGR02147 family)
MEQSPVATDIWTEAEAALANCRTYREFLETAFSHLKKRNKHFGYAEFSRRAGFSSRSYPRDVLVGKKRITARSLPQIIKALKLTPDLETLFTALVGSEEKEVSIEGYSSIADRKLALSKVQNRLRSRTESSPLLGRADKFYELESWLPVYVSLGTPEDGATLAQVVSRTRLSKMLCRKVLEEMTHFKVIRRAGEKFFTENFHLVFKHLGKSEFFKNQFLNSLKEVAFNADQDFEGKRQLFFHSVLSVDEKKMVALREELESVILKFVDRAESPHGDRVAKISLALYLAGEKKLSSRDKSPTQE